MATQARLPGLANQNLECSEETPRIDDVNSVVKPAHGLRSRPELLGDTAVMYVPAREILTKATGFMDAYDFTLNPYSGCSFGCTYCYAAFFSRDIQKRDTWGKWVIVKENAAELVRNRKPGTLDGKRIYLSSVTDPYQPVERQLGLTRGILQAMADRGDKPKLVVQTRSPDVVRDCDLYRRIEENGGRVQVNMTVTTDDEDIRRTFEPFCPSNPTRLEAIKEVQAQGVDTCITMTPLLLVTSPYAFADSLIETGVQKFIAQPFHFKQGKFLAGTRDGAHELMAEKLGCSVAALKNEKGEYLERYREFFDIFNDRLLEENLAPLGEGKSGFEPPF